MSQNELEPSRRTRSAGSHTAARRRRRKKNSAGRTILIVVLVLLAALIIAGLALFAHLYGLMDTSASRVGAPTASPTAEPAQLETPAPQNVVEDEPEPTEEPTPEPLTEEELRQLEEMQLMSSLQEDAEELIYSDNVYNILLLGADGRSEQIERSDAMILLSINKETKSIWLTSLMRDTLVNIPGFNEPHLNWATTFGGVDLLIETIESEKNFAVQVDNWALVNFVDFVKIAELVGPIEVDLTVAEIRDMNVRIREVARIMDVERPYFPEEDGHYSVTNGIQILAYCRERHIGGDTGRSQKQRDALVQMWNNVKKMSFAQQYQLMELVMSTIHTDLTPGKYASLMLSAPALMGYEIYAQQCPVIGSFWRGRDHLGLSIYSADFRVNRNFLRATIYGEPMTAADLTSGWTGVSTLVMEPTA